MITTSHLYIIILLCCCFYSNLDAQVITGIWKGNSAKTVFTKHPEAIVMEFSVFNDTVITGVSHLYYEGNKFEHHKINGKFNLADSTILLKESFIETNMPQGVFEVKYKMKLKLVNNNWRLEGNWKGVDGLLRYLPFNNVWLEKLEDSVEKKDTVSMSFQLAKADTLYKMPDRQTDIQRIIEITDSEKDSIKIDVYDNGEVDGDSISLYLNDKPIINKSIISEKPISFYLTLSRERQFDKIKMVAENLGNIPPNTALMIITTNKKRYEIRLTSDLIKTAAVEFVLHE
jgi:hypothetical protein